MKHNILKRLYIAGPLFSESELRFNRYLKKDLKPYFNVYLPQEDGGYMFTLIKNGMDSTEAAKTVFDNDIKAIRECDYLLIIMDGKSVDEGAAFELGFAYSLRKKCVGLQTDIRRSLSNNLNPMLRNSINPIFQSVKSLLEWAKSQKSK